jgi:AsmA protein
MPGGIASLDGSVKSDGKTATVGGKLRAEKLKLADRGTPSTRPVEFDFAAEHRLADSAGRGSTDTDVALRDAARLTGNYTRSAIRMALDGDAMPVPEFAAVLPALGIALPAGSSLQSGTASVKLAMEGPSDRLVTTGTIALKETTWGGFDLGRQLAVIATLAGMSATPSTKIETLGATVRMSPEGTTAENLALTVQSIGELAGAGTISPANALDFRMTAKVAHQAIPFLVTGTTTDPSFRPDVKAVVAEKAKGVAGGLLDRFLGGKKQ